jgi:hypothetical protein
MSLYGACAIRWTKAKRRLSSPAADKQGLTSFATPLQQRGVEHQPAAIALVALTGSFSALQSALRFSSFGRLRSVSHI